MYDAGFIVGEYSMLLSDMGSGTTPQQPPITAPYSVSSLNGNSVITTLYSDAQCTKAVSGPTSTEVPSEMLNCKSVPSSSSLPGGGGSIPIPANIPIPQSVQVLKDLSPDLPTITQYSTVEQITYDPSCKDDSSVFMTIIDTSFLAAMCTTIPDASGVKYSYKPSCSGPYKVSYTKFPGSTCQGTGTPVPAGDTSIQYLAMSLKPSCLDTKKGYFIGSTQCVPPGTTSWTSLGGLSSTGSHTQADSVGVGVGVGVALFVVLTAVGGYLYYTRFLRPKAPLAAQAQQDQERGLGDEVPAPVLASAPPALPRPSQVSQASQGAAAGAPRLSSAAPAPALKHGGEDL